MPSTNSKIMHWNDSGRVVGGVGGGRKNTQHMSGDQYRKHGVKEWKTEINLCTSVHP